MVSDDGATGAAGEDVHQLVGRERNRVVDRLRSLSLARLDRPGDDGSSPAELAHSTAQVLADLAADDAGRLRRELPRLPAHGAGDQLAVTADDALAECGERALRGALDTLVALRRRL